MVCQSRIATSGWLGPAKGPGHDGLIETVDANGVVRAAATEPVAPFGLAGVGVGAGIDQYLVVAGAKDDAQRVGMAVARVQGAERAGVDDGVRRPAGHHGDAGIGKEARFPLPCLMRRVLTG